MSELTLTDLDELVLTVRDRNSRSYIGEAITAYRARAYRSAVMSAWVAVDYDVIAKLRELAVQGDRWLSGVLTQWPTWRLGPQTGRDRIPARLQRIGCPGGQHAAAVAHRARPSARRASATRCTTS